jgi:hypothetical protein
MFSVVRRRVSFVHVGTVDKYGFGIHAFSKAAGTMQDGGTLAVTAVEEYPRP